MSNKKIDLNIQPNADILGIFSRLSYKPTYAIAEFVDNSTASFYMNEETLKNAGINSLEIDINYDDNDKSLTIEDNAFGMDLKNFTRAVRLDSKPEFQGGRNEFGMGLKTAASWFGNAWSVSSSELGSSFEYKTSVDIEELRQGSLNSISISENPVNPDYHYTKIKIKKLTKSISTRTKTSVISALSSMYRRDLNSGQIEIYFNGQPLRFKEYEALQYKNKTWKKDVELSFEFNERKYNVRGFVGILSGEGHSRGFGKAGFALFRRNRIVIGGEEQNYKPDIIFQQPQSQISLRLYGEFDLDDFPVNQAKDGFIWDDGLEEKFLNELKKVIKEYIDIAKKSNKEREKETELSVEKSEEMAGEVQETFNNIKLSEIIKEEMDNFENITPTELEDNDEGILLQDSLFPELKLYEKSIEEQNLEEIIHESTSRQYKIPVDKDNVEMLSVTWRTGDDSYWFKYEEETNEVLININHSFFKPYSSKEEFKKLIEYFVLAFILSEKMADRASVDGKIHSSSIRRKMNRLLKILAQQK